MDPQWQQAMDRLHEGPFCTVSIQVPWSIGSYHFDTLPSTLQNMIDEIVEHTPNFTVWAVTINGKIVGHEGYHNIRLHSEMDICMYVDSPNDPHHNTTFVEEESSGEAVSTLQPSITVLVMRSVLTALLPLTAGLTLEKISQWRSDLESRGVRPLGALCIVQEEQYFLPFSDSAAWNSSLDFLLAGVETDDAQIIILYHFS